MYLCLGALRRNESTKCTYYKLSSSVCAATICIPFMRNICKSRGRIVFPSRSCDAYNVYYVILSGQNHRVRHSFAAVVPRSITMLYVAAYYTRPRLEVVKCLSPIYRRPTADATRAPRRFLRSHTRARARARVYTADRPTR